MAVTPTPTDLVRARALYEKLRSAPYRTEDKVADLNDIARAFAEQREKDARAADQQGDVMYNRAFDCLCHHDAWNIAAAIRKGE